MQNGSTLKWQFLSDKLKTLQADIRIHSMNTSKLQQSDICSCDTFWHLDHDDENEYILITWFENEPAQHTHIPILYWEHSSWSTTPSTQKKLIEFQEGPPTTNHFPPDFLVNLQFVFIELLYSIQNEIRPRRTYGSAAPMSSNKSSVNGTK